MKEERLQKKKRIIPGHIGLKQFEDQLRNVLYEGHHDKEKNRRLREQAI